MEGIPSCSCSSWRRVPSPHPFVEYRLELRCGDIVWTAWRRFREFVALRAQLLSQLPAAKLALPAKHLHRHTVSKDDLTKRAPALAAWLNGLLSEEGALATPAVLEFVGLATALPATGTGRVPVHVSVLPQLAETGDLMLFRTRAAVPTLQRAVTRSNWDHVGLVVHFDWLGRVCNSHASAECGFIECDMSGTRFYGLQQYESYQWHLQYEQMSLRQLQWERRGSKEVSREVQEWYDEVKDKPYSLSLAKIAVSSRERTQSAQLQHANFFCSELVAYAYQRLGVLPTSQAACEYWPVSFGEAAALSLEGGAALGEELPVDFVTPGIASVRAVPRDRRASGEPVWVTSEGEGSPSTPRSQSGAGISSSSRSDC